MKKATPLFLIFPLVLSGCQNSDDVVPFMLGGNRFETLYNDSYFSLDNKEFHSEIAVASFASAMASIDDNKDYSARGDRLVELWEKEKFSGIHINQAYKEKPTLDSVGYGIANKRIGDFTLIAITIRGGGYEAEWASSFTVGASGNSSGFQNSANIVLEGVDDYLSKYDVTGHTKFWISGYCRGASVANLLAGTMLDRIAEGAFHEAVSAQKEDVYAYCFEPQNAACLSVEEAKGERYQGIHNVMNFNDVMTMLSPHQWGMVKYGQNHYFSDRLTDIRFDATERKKLVSNYHFSQNGQKLPGYAIDDWKFYDAGLEATQEKNLPRESLHPSLGRFAHNLIQAMTDFALSRDLYSYNEQGVRDLIGTIYGYNPDVEGIEISDQVFIDILFSYSFIQTMFLELQEGDSGGFTSDIEYLFYVLFNANENNVKAIQKLYDDLYYLLLFVCPSLALRADLLSQLFSRDNLLILTSAHAAELNYSFLRSSDPRLYGEQACRLNDGSYLTLHIKTPLSVIINEKTLNKNVLSFVNGQLSSDTLSAEKMADGSIDVYLPKNGQYEYRIASSSISLSNVDEYGTETILKEALPIAGAI